MKALFFLACCLGLVATIASAAASAAANAAASAAGSAAVAPTMVSVCGDPEMKLPPKILLEGWNFCNRCGRACTEAPRWADCVGPDSMQRVTPADNAAGLPIAAQSQSACDAFTEQKERNLGSICADGEGNSSSFFWTAMIKSGAMNVSERGRLCGLWCANKTPNCNAAGIDAAGAASFLASTDKSEWQTSNYIMRQPRVVHEWTKPDGSGGYQGSFYGTYDETADLSALPTPSQLIDEALAPKRPGPSLSGSWLGQGDARLVIAVTQAPGALDFSASCTWAPTPGVPAPWTNASGTVDATNRVIIHMSSHEDVGTVLAGEGRSADIICWSPTSWWCRNATCDGGASVRCAKAPPSPASNVSSYFGMEWVNRGGQRVHRHVLRTGQDLGWVMLYTGPEAARGLKGGYEWEGRGQYYITPQSTTRNASSWDPAWGVMPRNNFQVRQWTNISLWPGGPGFYFLNYGACWKDTGVQCDGDISTDVTRYLLFQIPAPGVEDTAARCGPLPSQRDLCPPYHRYRNGTVVNVDDTARFPYRAYHSVSTRVRGADGAFHCKHDCWSNPCDQDWLRLEPAEEWAEYGFPSTVAEAMSPHLWLLDAGAVSAAVCDHFSGLTPPIMEWTTLNMGPEMAAAPGAIAVWEVAGSDVLIEAGSQTGV